MNALPSHPLVVLLTAACVGICADACFSSVGACWWLGALVGWCVWVLSWRRQASRCAEVALLVSVVCGMAAWHHFSWRVYPEDQVALPVLHRFEPVPVAVRCIARSIPESTPLLPQQALATIPAGVSSRFIADAVQWRNGTQWSDTTGKLSVRVSGHILGVGVGDEVEIYGQLSAVAKPMNPGDVQAGFADRTQRILARLEVPYPDCVIKRRGSSGHPLAIVGSMRSAGLRLLDQHVGSPRGVLAGALLLGARNRLDPQRSEVFFHTGTIHLLAISGLHVGILAGLFFLVAKAAFANRNFVLMLLMLATVVYCLLTEMRAPVLRASILVVVVCVGLIWRRNILPYNSLAAAALVVLALRPADLFRPGAQLSFLAVLTLVWLSSNYQPTELDPLDRLVARSRPWHHRFLRTLWLRLWQLAIAGLAIWLVTLPIVMHRFHLVSPIALGLNLVLAFPIAVALVSGFGVLMSGSFAPPLADVLGSVCHASLAFVESTVQWAHELPGAYFWVAGPPAAWCGVFYVGLVLMAFVPRLRPTRAWAVACLAAWTAIPLVHQWVAAADRDQPLRCTFLSVGHGTCVVMEMPDRRVVIYDAGRMGIPQSGVRMVSGFLWYCGISHVDAIVVSHADADHYNIVPGLLERFSVQHVLVSPVMFAVASDGVEVFRQSMQQAAVRIAYLQADDLIRFGPETTLRVLHPLKDGVRGSDNANSIVLEVEHQGRKILLPGDLEAAGLEQVTAEMPRDCDVLMAPHHGSMGSSPIEFTDWCTPEYVVISGRYEPEAIEQQRRVFEGLGCQVLHTAESGAITVEISGGDLSLRAFHQ